MMPIYVTVAYAVFCAVPLGLAVSLHLRRRRLMDELRSLRDGHPDDREE